MENKNMKIAICGSISFTDKINVISEQLKEVGHVVEIPLTSQKILSGQLSMQEFEKEKSVNGDGSFRKIQDDVIRRYYNLIAGVDCILVVNDGKKGISGYVGGNTFLEMGFAYVLNKKIFLLNAIPDMQYTDEIKAMQPTVLNGDLSKIK